MLSSKTLSESSTTTAASGWLALTYCHVPDRNVVTVLYEQRGEFRVSVDPDVLKYQVACVADMRRTPLFMLSPVDTSDIADGQSIMPEVPVSRTNRGHAILDLYTVNDDVTIDHPRLTVILNINTVEAGLRVNVTNCDVLATIGYFNRASEL